MSATAYVEWVERVFAALVGVHEDNPLIAGISLTPVAERLELGPLARDDFSRGDDPASALLEALHDLYSRGVISRVHVSSGNVLTSLGRSVRDHGFADIREPYHEGVLSPTERVFLSRAVHAGFRRGQGWVRLAPIDPEPIWATVWEGTDEHVGRVKLVRFLRDLFATDYLSEQARPLVRPTYITAVALTRPDPSAALETRLIDWSLVDAGWKSIEQRIADLKVELAAARNLDDLQDVGRRCREIAMDAVETVFNRSMVPDGEEMPSPRDAKRLLELYLAKRAPGRGFEEYRRFLKAALDLANAQVRAKTQALPGAVASAQGLLSFVRALQFLDASLGSVFQEEESQE